MAADYKSLVSGKPEFVARWHQICDEHARKEAEWITSLRARGIKAAHPNDGWVDRDNNELHFAYPQFNDGADVGDLVMLGWEFDPKSWRLVRLTARDDRGMVSIMTYWKFEDAMTPTTHTESDKG